MYLFQALVLISDTNPVRTTTNFNNNNNNNKKGFCINQCSNCKIANWLGLLSKFVQVADISCNKQTIDNNYCRCRGWNKGFGLAGK